MARSGIRAPGMEWHGLKNWHLIFSFGVVFKWEHT